MQIFFFFSGNGKISSCAAAEGSFTSLTGLLEVEPLHFTCVSTSDGTRIERDDASTFTGIYNFSFFFLLGIVQQHYIFLIGHNKHYLTNRLPVVL